MLWDNVVILTGMSCRSMAYLIDLEIVGKGFPIFTPRDFWLAITAVIVIRHAIEPHGIPVRMTRVPHSKLRSRGQVPAKGPLTHP